MSPQHRGVTLIEMLATISIMLILVLSMGNLDDLRLQIERRIRQRGDPDHLQAALAMLHIAKHLEPADRLNFIPDRSIYQLRIPVCPPGIPAPSCFDDQASYRWEQYQLLGEGLWFLSDAGRGCGNRKRLATHIAEFTMAFQDAEPLAPPGGEPAMQDNNVVEYAITWSKEARVQEFRGTVTIRASGYTDVSTGLQDPGQPDLSPPPAPCA